MNNKRRSITTIVSIPYLVYYCAFISSGDGVPTIFVAVAGRSNGLGPVMSGNTVYPVINCPPVTSDWGAQDIWSSLRMPSGKYSSANMHNQCCAFSLTINLLKIDQFF